MTQSRQTHRPPLLGRRETYTAITAAVYTAKAGDRIIGVNRAGVVTVTFPSAEVRPGRLYTVKDESGSAGANNITIATEGSETIDGAATFVIGVDYASADFYSNGSNWFTLPLVSVSAHQATHNDGGADPLKLDDLATPNDNTDLDFSTSLHGLVPKGTNVGDFLKDNGSWASLQADISCRVYNDAAQSISNNTQTVLTFNQEVSDSGGMHSTSSNTSRITIPSGEGGVYILTAYAGWAFNTTGQRIFNFYLNGTTQLDGYLMSGASGITGTLSPAIAVTCSRAFIAGDYIEVRVYQTSGGALNIGGLAEGNHFFTAVKIR